jgi:hypothetical protein
MSGFWGFVMAGNVRSTPGGISKIRTSSNIFKKEIKMFTNRLFNLILAAVLVVVIVLAAQHAFATKAIVPETSGVYTESNEQALREFQLGERYGEFPPHVAQFSAVPIRREFLLGERYGVTPQGYAEQQALREYWLGEKYGQTP